MVIDDLSATAKTVQQQIWSIMVNHSLQTYNFSECCRWRIAIHHKSEPIAYGRLFMRCIERGTTIDQQKSYATRTM